jgi:hypothetical protein
MHPDLTPQEERKRIIPDNKKERTHAVNDTVWIQDLPAKTWISGVIKQKIGNKM